METNKKFEKLIFRHFEHFFTKYDISLNNWLEMPKVIIVFVDMDVHAPIIILNLKKSKKK